ncbi:hypothetical protein Aph01nite_29610 [Acrocarpospora phusangensis]|uniref:Uncharacterized protein n=1 Tax=Acrocarpospora phusangensis TaxID=1070424 RepID=A0A919QAV7_9ACTN|nr:hypothetical protein Aph01nite_29610 [Acrocarpospora phusangensis]
MAVDQQDRLGQRAAVGVEEPLHPRRADLPVGAAERAGGRHDRADQVVQQRLQALIPMIGMVAVRFRVGRGKHK